MKKDRSHWTVKKVSFAEAEELDNKYYSSLSDVERLIILMELRSLMDPGENRVQKVVVKRKLDEEKI